MTLAEATPTRLASHLAELERAIEGEVSSERVDRMLYATDASIYQDLPLGIVRPRNRADCAVIVRWASKHAVPLIPRAAGTSLAGQVVGEGLVVDVSRHLTRIGEIDVDDHSVDVEPGVILEDLNDRVVADGLHFGPDTSTANRCMIGGMIGNNACGEHSIVHGTTRDHTIAIDAVLADGSEVRFGPLDDDELAAKRKRDDVEGRIYAAVCDLIDARRDAILAAYPDPSLIRRNTGYALDALCRMRPWEPGGSRFNLAPLICGSEGTLCLLTGATVNLIPPPKARAVVCGHFRSVDEACHAAVTAVAHGPAAAELVDGVILEATKGNLEQSRNRFWVDGDPPAVLIVEFFADDEDDARRRCDELVAAWKRDDRGYAFPALTGADIPRVWSLRKAGLGLLMGRPGKRKAVPGIEDAAVPVARLPEYVARVDEILARHGCSCVHYAHASVGLLHLRPELDLGEADDRRILREICDEVAEVVKEFGGSFSGEHGDGRLRGRYVRTMFGDEVFAAMERVKRTFDPDGLFNPGKIVDAPPMDDDLRPFAEEVVEDTWFDWSGYGGLRAATEKCNGAGACRKSPGRGTMCPSYHATLEERDSTRGRANVFRQLLGGERPLDTFADDDLAAVLDLCLSCKACKSECPASVDMARLKAEFLQQRYARLGVPARAKRFAGFAEQARWASRFPRLANLVTGWGWVKRFAGVDPRRSMPAFAAQRFSKRRPPPAGDGPEVAVHVDEFCEYLEPEIAEDACRVIAAAGYRPVPVTGCWSGRAPISKGLLDHARRQLAPTLAALDGFARRGVPIVGIEPSAILGFRDEIPALMRGEDAERARRVAEHALTFEEWLAKEEVRPRWRDDAPATRTLLHGHCHAKALVGTGPSVAALAKVPGLAVETLATGCCGMAGSFGYERDHYEVSMTIGEQILLPAVRAAADDVLICAPGTSCRHQIFDGSGRIAAHPARIAAARLADGGAAPG